MAARDGIHNGDEVKDTITGLTGIVVCITTWINGCQRIGIQPKEIKDGKPVDISIIDVEQLEVIKAAAPVALPASGGDHPRVEVRR